MHNPSVNANSGEEVGVSVVNPGFDSPSDKNASATGGEVGLSSVPYAIFNLTKVLIGAGIFTGPDAMLKSGFFGYIITIMITTSIMFITSLIVLNAGEKKRDSDFSYRGTCLSYLGVWGGRSESVLTWLLATGSMVSYALLVSNSLPPFLIKVFGWTEEELSAPRTNDDTTLFSVSRIFLDRRILLLISTIFILYPLGLLKNIHFLAYSSFFGLFCFAFIFLSLSYKSVTLPPNQKGTMTLSESLNFFVPAGIVSAISRATFMNITHHMNFFCIGSLKKRTPSNVKTVIFVSLSISTFFCIVFSAICYLSIREKVTSNIFDSFSSKDTLVNICRLALSFHIMASFCLNNFASREALFRLVLGDNVHMNKRLRYVFGSLSTLFPVAVAMFVCDLGVVVDLTGGVAAGAISTILPGFIWLRIVKNEDRIRSNIIKVILAFLLIIYGFAIIAYVIYDSIRSSSGGGGPPKVCPYRFL